MRKYSAEDKLRMVKLVLEAKHSIRSIALSEGVHPATLEGWFRNYQSMGSETFYNKGWTKRTYAEKEISVQEYLSGLGSLRDICKKHKISSTRTLRQWIALYNGHKKLKASGAGGSSLMSKGRKTTFEERKEIVDYCINHNRNYKNTAAKFDVSYGQVYSWVKKYDTNGADGLTDRRGRHKTDAEVDELERLRRENLRLKRQLEEKDMVVELLKKVKEFEGM